MSASKVTKQIMVERGLSVKDLAALLEMKPQILRNKLYRGVTAAVKEDL